MTDAAQLALVTAIPPTIAALGAIVVTVLSRRMASRKLDHITVLTNSTLTAANARIDALHAEVAKLTALISQRDRRVAHRPRLHGERRRDQ